MEDLGLTWTDQERSFWTDRPVLITGASGLLGGWLTRALVDLRSEIVVLLRDWVPKSTLLSGALTDEVTVVRGDVSDQTTMERVLNEYEVEAVFHLAAQTIVGTANRNPPSTFDTNIKGTWTLLEACRRSPTVKRIVVASSDKAYGDQKKLPYTEAAPLEGRHPYDVSKSCADLICRAYFESFGLPVCVTRCGNFYGGGDLNWNRIVPGTIRSLFRGERPIIRSDGTLVRDYFFVKDAVVAYLHLCRLMDRPEVSGEAFNFSNEIQLSALDLVKRITQAWGTPDVEPVVQGKATNEILHQYLCATKARDVLGWRPRFDLPTGLNQTIEWYRCFLGANE